MGSILCCCCRKNKAPKSPLGDVKYGMVPTNYRKCHDCLCCVLFLVFWIGMVVVAAIGFANGDVKRLLYGTDYRGETCGKDALSDLKLITYPRYTQDYIINLDVSNPLDYKFYGVCVESCPKQFDVVCNFDAAILTEFENDSNPPTIYTQENMLNCLNATVGASYPASFDCDVVKDDCYVTPIDTASVFFRCIPVNEFSRSVDSVCTFPSGVTDANDPECIIVKENIDGELQKPAQTNLLFEQLNDVRNVWSRYFGDVQRSWVVIMGCGVLIALVMSFVWVYFLKCCAGVMVWLTIFMVVALSVALTFVLYFKAGILDPDDFNVITDRIDTAVSSTQFTDQLHSSNDNKDLFKYAAYAFTAFSIILLCVIVALRKSINTAIKVVKLGARSLMKVPGAVFYPIISVLFLLALLVWWVFVAASLASAGEISTADIASDVEAALAKLNDSSLNVRNLNETFKFVDDDDISRYLLIYHFFGLLWTNQVIQAIGVTTIAGSVAGWYFSLAPNPEAEKYKFAQPRCAVWQAFKRTLRFHFGSMVFGALLIALIQFVRAILAYFQRQADRAKKNRVIRCLMCCVQSCLRVLQTIVSIVTRNSFIMIAIKGISFCSAGRKVFKLIFENLAVLAVVNMLGEIVMFLGKVVVACTSAFFCYWILDRSERYQEGGEDELSSIWLSVVLTLLFAYAVAAAFFYVYDIAVDTMLICFIIDGQENLDRGGKKAPIHVDPDFVSKLTAAGSGAAAAAAGGAAAAGAGAGAGGDASGNPDNAGSSSGSGMRGPAAYIGGGAAGAGAAGAASAGGSGGAGAGGSGSGAAGGTGVDSGNVEVEMTSGTTSNRRALF